MFFLRFSNHREVGWKKTRAQPEFFFFNQLRGVLENRRKKPLFECFDIAFSKLLINSLEENSEAKSSQKFQNN